jgi:methionine-rich copper-binding protein CopC
MLGLLLLVPSAAIAHGVLRSSRPAAGARLTAVPTELRLVFNEAVERAVARLTLLGPDSQAIALGALGQPGDSTTVLLADITGPLTTPGRYTVNWQVVGRDGHPISDRFTFVIADGAAGLVDPAALAPADTAPPACRRRR